jgi:hypothetical protein
MGMPVVSNETMNAITSRYLHRNQGQSTDWGLFLTQVKERLLSEDPQLVAFIQNQVSRFPQELHAPILEILVGMYAVIEHQAHANTLE